MTQQDAIQPAESCADPSDLATKHADFFTDQADFFTDQAMQAQTLVASAHQVAPRDDGECACGCGREVNPARLALGYGLAIECAEAKGPKRR
jgi:hypothetical protein